MDGWIFDSIKWLKLIWNKRRWFSIFFDSSRNVRSFLSFSFGGFPKYVKSCWTWLKFCWINLHIYILRIISHCKCSLIHYPIETFWVNPSSKHTTERQDRIKVQHDSCLSILLYKKIMLMQRRYIEERTKFSQCLNAKTGFVNF